MGREWKFQIIYSTNTETVAGVDASFQIDGVTVTRSNNIIDDVIDGASLTFLPLPLLMPVSILNSRI